MALSHRAHLQKTSLLITFFIDHQARKGPPSLGGPHCIEKTF